MSRSHKKTPMGSYAGSGSKKYDKHLAAKGVRAASRRRLEKYILQDSCRDDDFLMPHMRECSHNNNYSWGCDGGAAWMGLEARHYADYLKAVEYIKQPGYKDKPDWWRRWTERDAQWPPVWYNKMMRK